MISNDLIDAAIAGARTTRAADFSHQKICFLGNLGRLSAMDLRLNYLDLQHNSLKILDNLPPIITLERFDVSYNQLRQITALLPFPRLKVFAARSNAIQFVSSQFPACIEVIDLDGNQIDSEGQIKSCLAARVLRLENNPIQRREAAAALSGVPQADVQGGAESVFRPAKALQSQRPIYLSAQKRPEPPQPSPQSFSQRQTAIKAYEELLQLYEKQLESQGRVGFPSPEKPQNLSVLRRAVFQLIFDRNALQRENEALRQKLEQYEREILQAGQKDRLVSEQAQELRDELLSASNENVQLHTELQAQFSAWQAAALELQLAAAAVRDFLALLTEQTQEALDSVEMLGRRVGKCQQAVRGFKMPKKEAAVKAIQTEFCEGPAGTARYSQTEPPGLVIKATQANPQQSTDEKEAQTDEIAAAQSGVFPAPEAAKDQPKAPQELQEPAIEPPDCQEMLPSFQLAQPAFQPQTGAPGRENRQQRPQAANGGCFVPLRDDSEAAPRQNPLLMSQEDYSRFADSIKRTEQRLRASDLESSSVLRIAQKYQHIDPPGADWRAGHEAEPPDRPMQIRFFGVRPQSFVAQQLEQLELE